MMNITFIKSVKLMNQLPKLIMPEIVLAGRSNVGKSSFINNIFNRKNIALTSSNPGKTRLINYYNVDDKFYIVDLPGFGYAKVSKKEREEWHKLIGNYFRSDRQIVTIFHLIDARHHPTDLDLLLNELLISLQLPYTLVLNKVDKLKQSEIARRKSEIRDYFPEASYGDNLLLHSAVKGTGKKEIVSRLHKLFY
ncbi:MAG: ribosome biogenesis GTP-binding protein YihA/YsxC [Melioribacteraceae bacterium]|nr:MAG: ribosome biogenesis GTP-binding protein YihA/YsxC [Melioribacteraceae bacterium]